MILIAKELWIFTPLVATTPQNGTGRMHGSWSNPIAISLNLLKREMHPIGSTRPV
jgi:hypothetical protein